MKRILTVALIFCLLTTPLALFGCKQENTNETAGTATGNTAGKTLKTEKNT